MAAKQSAFKRNLICNPYGEDGFSGWEIVNTSRGNGFTVEDPPAGSDPLSAVGELDGVATSCFATTHYLCKKQQMIDLYKLGCSEDVMTNFKPAIYICDWYASRFDCGSKYTLSVQLLDKDDDEVDTFEFKHEEPNDSGVRKWRKVEHTFTRTKTVRYVKFIHSGQDSKNWAGQYGAKMTGSTVIIKPH